MEKVEFEFGGRSVGIETGRLAKQSRGSVVVTCGGSAVLVTVNSAKPRPGIDFFPLTVDYIEKYYAAGKVPGGFFKREGRLTEKEILTSRFIDRALRPLFPDAYRDETQVTAQVFSADPDFDTDVLAFIGASAAVNLSDLPFPCPIGACRVGRVEGELVLNPSFEQLEQSDVNIIVAGRADALIMVEGGADQVADSEILEALQFGHRSLAPALEAQAELIARAGKQKREVSAAERDEALVERLRSRSLDGILEASQIRDKKERYAAFDALEAEAIAEVSAELLQQPLSIGSLAELESAQATARRTLAEARSTLHDLRGEVMRERILAGDPRIDGRGPDEIRPISCEVGVFPRNHGSALFTRGETQALGTITLGGSADEQVIDGLRPRFSRRFMLHYNFLPFSVGEVRPLRGPNRRETGHGALAERAILAILPDDEESPYTVRAVSEILESNGSSSMATVCATTLSLMHAGIQIKAPVAGIAMGLIQEGDRYAVLSDILGDEDHLGDMDFKVAGSTTGITSIQMDIKISGLDWKVVEKAMAQARDGRLHILECMARETAESLPGFVARSEMSETAPRVHLLWIKPDRIRDLIGPGGKVIRAIQESSGAKIDVDDSGRVMVFGPDLASVERCKSMIEELTQEAEIGRNYSGKVKKVTDFGAFVEIFPGTDGLLHISEMADRRVARVEDICVEGDDVLVKCIDVDPSGRIRLSRRAALAESSEDPEKRA